MYVILDMSKAMEDQDLKPNRALSAIKVVFKIIQGVS